MSENKELLVHILQKVDKIQEDVFHVRESQVRTEINVAEHIRRTNLLEISVAELKRLVGWLVVPIDLIRCVLKWLRLLR